MRLPLNVKVTGWNRACQTHSRSRVCCLNSLLGSSPLVPFFALHQPEQRTSYDYVLYYLASIHPLRINILDTQTIFKFCLPATLITVDPGPADTSGTGFLPDIHISLTQLLCKGQPVLSTLSLNPGVCLGFVSRQGHLFCDPGSRHHRSQQHHPQDVSTSDCAW